LFVTVTLIGDALALPDATCVPRTATDQAHGATPPEIDRVIRTRAVFVTTS
jgi:hypothetical protein